MVLLSVTRRDPPARSHRPRRRRWASHSPGAAGFARRTRRPDPHGPPASRSGGRERQPSTGEPAGPGRRVNRRRAGRGAPGFARAQGRGKGGPSPRGKSRRPWCPRPPAVRPRLCEDRRKSLRPKSKTGFNSGKRKRNTHSHPDRPDCRRRDPTCHQTPHPCRPPRASPSSQPPPLSPARPPAWGLEGTG